MNSKPRTFDDCVSPEYRDLWASGHLVPLTATLDHGCVVTTEWAWNRYTLSLLFWSFGLLLCAIPFIFSGWVFGLLAFVSIIPVFAIFAGLHFLLWSGSLSIVGREASLVISFPKQTLEIECQDVADVTLYWVLATKNHIGRRMGAVVVQATVAGRAVSIPVFLSYNKRECHKAQSLIIQLLGQT